MTKQQREAIESMEMEPEVMNPNSNTSRDNRGFGEKVTVTAEISRNLRETNSLYSKVLIRNITNLDGTPFRDHAWITINKNIEAVMPKSGDNKWIKIEVSGKIVNYNGSNGARKSIQVKTARRIN